MEFKNNLINNFWSTGSNSTNLMVAHGVLVLRQLPCEFGEIWISTSKVINEISVKFDWVFLKVIHLDVNSDVNSQPFIM